MTLAMGLASLSAHPCPLKIPSTVGWQSERYLEPGSTCRAAWYTARASAVGISCTYSGGTPYAMATTP